jgi:hypothetical protein
VACLGEGDGFVAYVLGAHEKRAFTRWEGILTKDDLRVLGLNTATNMVRLNGAESDV